MLPSFLFSASVIMLSMELMGALALLTQKSALSEHFYTSCS